MAQSFKGRPPPARPKWCRVVKGSPGDKEWGVEDTGFGVELESAPPPPPPTQEKGRTPRCDHKGPPVFQTLGLGGGGGGAGVPDTPHDILSISSINTWSKNEILPPTLC